MIPTRRALRFDWGVVSCLEWEPADGAWGAVLLLHGGGVDNAELSWGEVGPALASAGYRVLAPDYPGFGESPLAPWTASQQRLVDFVGELVDALALRRYSVGGLSLGGGLALGHTLARPERVSGTILLGSYGLMDHMVDGPLGVPAHLLTWAMLRTGLLHAIQRLYARNRRLMDSSLRSIVRDPARLTKELLDQCWAAAQRPDGFVAFEQWQRDQLLRNGSRDNYTERLNRFPRPTLVIHGTHDTGVPVIRAREAAARIPDGRLLVIEGAGHWVQRDRPDLVLPAMVDFLHALDGAPDAASADS